MSRRGSHSPETHDLFLKLGLKAPDTSFNRRAEDYSRRANRLAKAKECRDNHKREKDARPVS